MLPARRAVESAGRGPRDASQEGCGRIHASAGIRTAMSVHPWMDVAGSADSVVQELRGDGAMGELKIEQKRQSRRPRRAVEPQD